MGDLPMGLLGCPASFQRLMEKVLDGIRNPIVNIDDAIIHTATHQHQLQVLKHVLKKIGQTQPQDHPDQMLLQQHGSGLPWVCAHSGRYTSRV